MATAFNDAQRTTSAHRRARKQLLSAFRASPTAFFSAFTHCLNRALLVFSRQPAVERLVAFVAHFAATAETDDGNFRSVLLAYLLEQANATAPAVRFRSTQLLAATLNAMPEDAELADELWEPLQDAVLSRALDRVPRVRAAAAAALCRLQITADPQDDPFAERLVSMVAKDSSAAVRKAALQAIAISGHTLPAVVARTRDVRADVRRVAYETLALRVPPLSMNDEELVRLLRTGLADRDQGVRKACTETLLLTGWLDGACEGNVFTLCELLGCNEREDDVLRALRVVFASERHEMLIDAIEIDLSAVKHADVLILRAMADTQKGEAFMDKFFANTIEYTNVIQYYSVDDFASRHLLELCKSVDMGDEAGRKALENVVRADFLSSHYVSEETVAYAVRAMRRAMLDEEATLRILLEIVRQDVLTESTGGEEQDEQGEGGAELQDVSDEDREWKEMRALNIVKEALRISRQGESSAVASNSLCRSLMEIAVLPQLLCISEDIRHTAMECLGLFCLLDRSGAEAKANMPLFIQASKTDVPAVQELTMQILVDFFMVFDFSDDKIGNEQDASLSAMAEECVNILSENITHADGSMRSLAIQGLTRLLFVRRIAPSPTLLTRMLIAHHNPTTEDDDQLRQCLSVFFPAFAISSPANRLGLEDSFKQTCRILTSAPSKSPLSTISVVQVAQFILHLTNPASVPKKQNATLSEDVGRSADQTHERLAEVVLNEIIDATESDETEICRTYGRILSSFRFSCTADNQGQIRILRKLAQSATDESDDKRTTTVLKRFRDRMSTILEKAEEAGIEEQAVEPEEEEEEPAEEPEIAASSDVPSTVAQEENTKEPELLALSGGPSIEPLMQEASEVTGITEASDLAGRVRFSEAGTQKDVPSQDISTATRRKSVEEVSQVTPRRRSTRLSKLQDSETTSRTDDKADPADLSEASEVNDSACEDDAVESASEVTPRRRSGRLSKVKASQTASRADVVTESGELSEESEAHDSGGEDDSMGLDNDSDSGDENVDDSNFELPEEVEEYVEEKSIVRRNPRRSSRSRSAAGR